MRAFLAGLAIAGGAAVYLGTNCPWLFGIGLLIVLCADLDLYTGRILTLNDPFELAYILLLNILGSIVGGLVLRFFFDISPVIAAKEALSPFRIFFSAAACELLIYAAVCCYKRAPKPLDTIGVFFFVGLFVYLGLDHCIADSVYYAMSTSTEWPMVILPAILGNTACGALIQTFDHNLK